MKIGIWVNTYRDIMLVYKRNITTKLLLLRLSFILTISFCVYFFTVDNPQFHSTKAVLTYNEFRLQINCSTLQS